MDIRNNRYRFFGTLSFIALTMGLAACSSDTDHVEDAIDYEISSTYARGNGYEFDSLTGTVTELGAKGELSMKGSGEDEKVSREQARILFCEGYLSAPDSGLRSANNALLMLHMAQTILVGQDVAKDYPEVVALRSEISDTLSAEGLKYSDDSDKWNARKEELWDIRCAEEGLCEEGAAHLETNKEAMAILRGDANLKALQDAVIRRCEFTVGSDFEYLTWDDISPTK